MYEFL